MYALIRDDQIVEYPFNPDDLTKYYPNTSFPRGMSLEDMEEFGVFKIYPIQAPTYDLASEKVEEGRPHLHNGRWEMSWSTTQLTPEEKENAAHNQASAIRTDRATRLAQSDWTQLSDAPVPKEAWSLYRQALRDIPEQAGFPWTIEWPTPPES